MFAISVLFVSTALLQIGFCQRCKLKTPENNLLTMAVGETFRLPLTDYFTGEGLTYTLSNNSGFKLSNEPWGPGTVTGTILSTTSSSLNQNPYIQSYQYYALSQTNNEYQIYGSVYKQTVSFSNLIVPTINSGNCYVINTSNDLIVVTCLTSTNNQLTYMVYNTEGVFQNSFPLPKITANTSATFNTQTSKHYTVTLISEGTIENGTYTSSPSSSLNVFQFNGTIAPYQINLNIDLANGDYVTGFQLLENQLFITTFYSGASLYDIQSSNLNAIHTKNPFNQGTLGISTYNIDYPSNYYYIAIWSSSGIVTSIYNTEQNQISQTQQIFQTIQINEINMFQTQVYLNPRYIVVVNNNGISVYPSIFNDINEGQLLFFYPQSSIASSYDYYNSMLISVQKEGVQTYQFNDPMITTVQTTLTQLPLAEHLSNLSITATPNVYNQTSAPCSVLTFYYQVISYPNGSNVQVYQTYKYVETINNNQYDQLGQQFNINFGSSQFININKILIGQALYIQSPTVQPAISNQIDTQYSTILKAPQIKSQYKVNSNLFDGKRALFSQLFYDPTTLTINNANSQLSDSYYQLIQYDDFILLLQCQGIKDSPCQEIIEIPETDKLVQYFALSVNDGQINLAYYYNEVNLGQRAIGKMTVFSVFQDGQSPTGYSNYNNTFSITKKEIVQELYVNSIAMLGTDLYVLYSATSGVKQSQTYTYIQIADATQLAQGMSIEDGYQYQLPDQYFIHEMYYDVISYGKLIFLQTSVGNSFYISIINYNNNQAQIVSQIPLTFNGVPVQGNDYCVFYGLSMDGIYIVDSNPQPAQLYFIPRVDLLSIVYQSQQQVNPINLDSIIKPIQLPLFNVSSVVRAYGSARFFYIMVQETNSYSLSIYVYRNSPTVLNSLYYVIRAQENSVMYEESFSVISALQYDAIIFRSEGGNFYTSGYLLPELEIQVNCNLNSNSQYQVTYNYLGFKANSLLFGTTMPSTTQQLWVSFQITNLISFVQEKSTLAITQLNGQPITLNANGQAFLDPRIFFTGNIQTFTITNSTLASGYYFNMIPTVVSQPQISVFQNPVTAVSAMVSFNANGQAKNGSKNYQDASYQNQYWCTFVQTNHIVYVTPYMYYNPSSPAFVDNSTVSIDYPLTYKLPILDPSPNSQNCPLIFVDQLSQGIVSVCGSNKENNFLVSFTIFNPYTQLIQETQIINITNAFTIDLLNNDGNAIYILQSASYLEIGVVILQFRYTYNLGQNPPTDIILPFVYAANLAKPTVTNLNGQPSYQMIQPIEAVSYIQHQDLANLFIISPFSVSTQFMGGLPTASDASMMYGLLCVSNSNEECLVTSSDSVSSSGVVVTVEFSTTIGEFMNGSSNITVLPATFGTQTNKNNVYSSLNFSVFDVSIINALSDYTINSIQQIVQAGTPMVYEFVYSVPFVVVSQGTAYVTKLSFYQTNGQFITTKYSCTLAGLTNQNKILQVSTGGYGTNYQVVAVVSNPKTNDINQVTLLNYGIINQWCRLSSQSETSTEVIVTAIGSYTYQSVESTPVLSLMFPSPLPETNIDKLSNIPRTLISNNKIIQLLDTNPKLILSAYPDYNVNQGVTLSNTTGIISSVGIQTQITAQPIEIYINNNLLNGATGSSLFTFQSTAPPQLEDKVWFHKITGQFIWGSIMFAIIAGVITFLFYKSQPLPYDYA